MKNNDPLKTGDCCDNVPIVTFYDPLTTNITHDTRNEFLINKAAFFNEILIEFSSFFCSILNYNVVYLSHFLLLSAFTFPFNYFSKKIDHIDFD